MKHLLLATLLLAWGGTWTWTSPPTSPVRLRVVTYNIHHGEGTDGRIDLERIAALLSGMQPDIVALQEVDRNTSRSGGVDQFATLERLDPSLLEAAADLGARPLETLWRVTIPLAAPGIRAGAILTFVPCLGTYLTSDLLGGSKTILVGNLVQNQFTTSRDWPFGAAASIVLMGVAILLMFAARRKGEELL